MIQSFRHRGLKRFYERAETKQINPQHMEKVKAILSVLDTARSIEELDLPTFRLHPLTGDRAGEWSITVRANWRIVFRFAEGNAFDVNLEDYH